jgi:hypothetical protein
MKAAQEEMPAIVRDAENKDNHSRYARLETVIAAISPVISKHGFSMSFGTDQSPIERHYRITCVVAHVGGHSRREFADVPADGTGIKGTPNKTATHAFGSTLSYGRRYLTLLIFNVALTDDDDGNAAGGKQTITEEQEKALQGLVMEHDIPIAKFFKFMGIEKLADLPANRFEEAQREIQNVIAMRAKKKQGEPA